MTWAGQLVRGLAQELSTARATRTDALPTLLCRWRVRRLVPSAIRPWAEFMPGTSARAAGEGTAPTGSFVWGNRRSGGASGGGCRDGHAPPSGQVRARPGSGHRVIGREGDEKLSCREVVRKAGDSFERGPVGRRDRLATGQVVPRGHLPSPTRLSLPPLPWSRCDVIPLHRGAGVFCQALPCTL